MLSKLTSHKLILLVMRLSKTQNLVRLRSTLSASIFELGWSWKEFVETLNTSVSRTFQLSQFYNTRIILAGTWSSKQLTESVIFEKLETIWKKTKIEGQVGSGTKILLTQPRETLSTQHIQFSARLLSIHNLADLKREFSPRWPFFWVTLQVQSKYRRKPENQPSNQNKPSSLLSRTGCPTKAA